MINTHVSDINCIDFFSFNVHDQSNAVCVLIINRTFDIVHTSTLLAGFQKNKKKKIKTRQYNGHTEGGWKYICVSRKPKLNEI